jgi:hypothetical protein
MKAGQFGRRAAGIWVCRASSSGMHVLHRLGEARHFRVEVFRAQHVMRRFQAVVRIQLGATDGIAAGNADAVQGLKGMGLSGSSLQRPPRICFIRPRRTCRSMRSTRASMASFHPAPMVSILMDRAPGAASIITPMMLLPLTRRPLRLSQTSA